MGGPAGPLGAFLPGGVWGFGRCLWKQGGGAQVQGGFKRNRRFLLLLLFFTFLATPLHMEFPGQGSDPSCSFDLSYGCGNPGSLTHRTRPGIEPVSLRSQDAASPIVSQQELLESLGKKKKKGTNLIPSLYFVSQRVKNHFVVLYT